MDVVLPLLTLCIGLLLGLLAGLRLRSGEAGAADAATRALLAQSNDQAVVRSGLDRLAEQVGELSDQRVSWQSQLAQQVDEVRHTTDSLRRETTALSTALRKPAVRGRWGELHLRRTVEVAGLVEHVDFAEQVHFVGADGGLRPDLVVHLAGGRSLVVDAKAPLDAYLDALAAGSEHEDQAEHLIRHARQLRHHVDGLSGKAYWQALGQSPQFVVLFVPAESCLAAALESDPALIEYAAARDVVLATPTTLIALLRTVAYGWHTETLAERTREIHELGRDLHARLGVMGGHLDKLGRALRGAVESYNKTVGSLESRVLVTARQFEDIGVSTEHLARPGSVVDSPRPLSASELLDQATPRRDELLEQTPGQPSPARRPSSA